MGGQQGREDDGRDQREQEGVDGGFQETGHGVPLHARPANVRGNPRLRAPCIQSASPFLPFVLSLSKHRPFFSASQRKNGPSTSSGRRRSEEHTSELPSLMRISYAVFCLKKKKQHVNSELPRYNNQTPTT